jgi:hypothetical protein
MAGEGGHFNMKQLYYLSVHSLDKKCYTYGKARISREVSNAWVESKFIFGGARFDDATVSLTDEAPFYWMRLSVFPKTN